MKTSVKNALEAHRSWLNHFPGGFVGAASVAVQQITSKPELASLITAVCAETEPARREYATSKLINEFDHRDDVE